MFNLSAAAGNNLERCPPTPHPPTLFSKLTEPEEETLEEKLPRSERYKPRREGAVGASEVEEGENWGGGEGGREGGKEEREREREGGGRWKRS